MLQLFCRFPGDFRVETLIIHLKLTNLILGKALADELDILDVESVQFPWADNSPEGAKDPAVDVGTILVTMAEVGGITALTTVLGSWLSHDKSRTLKFKVSISSIISNPSATPPSTSSGHSFVRPFDKLRRGLRMQLRTSL